MLIVALDPGIKNNALLYYDTEEQMYYDAALQSLTSHSESIKFFSEQFKKSAVGDFPTVFVVEDQDYCSKKVVRDNQVIAVTTMALQHPETAVLEVRPTNWRRKLKVAMGEYTKNKSSSGDFVQKHEQLRKLLRSKRVSFNDFHHFGDCAQMIDYYLLLNKP